MAWIELVIAGGLEVFWSTFMKLSEGFTKLWPTVWTVLGMLASFFFLSRAVHTLPMGTAYAVWTGIGALARCWWASCSSASRSRLRGCCSWRCC